MYNELLNICNLPPIETDFAIPAPPETTKPPVIVDVELSVELNVALPVAAPIDITVAAPKALIVVAFALSKANVPLLVVMLVKKSGEVAPEVNSVPAVGNVTLDAAVVVRVKLFAPEVINEEPFAKVNVALVAGAVNISLLYVEAETFPFCKRTPETDDVEPAEVNNVPPIPTPPVTTNAPELEDIET